MGSYSQKIIIRRNPELPRLDKKAINSKYNYKIISGSSNSFLIDLPENDQELLLNLDKFEKEIRSTKPLIDELIISDSLLISNDLKISNQLNETLINLISLIIDFNSNNITNLQIHNKSLRSIANKNFIFNSKKLLNLNTAIIDDLNDLEKLPLSIKNLTINLDQDYLNENFQLSKNSKEFFYSLDSLTINDSYYYSSLNFYNQIKQSFLRDNIKLNLTTLKFNYLHDFHSINNNSILDVFSLNDLINLEDLKNLELIINCTIPDCQCLDVIFQKQFKNLNKNLKSLSLFQIFPYYDDSEIILKNHNDYENWDLIICSFIPNYLNLENLLIFHDSPIDGSLKNSFEGNYIRRRKIYENALINLKNLRTLLLPSFLSQLSCYELLTNDLIWNGCECDTCLVFHPIIDNYLMSHQFYNSFDYDFNDVVSTCFFAFLSDSMQKRVPFLKENTVTPNINVLDINNFNQFFQISDNFLKNVPAILSNWNFHGYLNLTCTDYSNLDDTEFFSQLNGSKVKEEHLYSNGSNCGFNKAFFNPLMTIIIHFFKEYVDWFVTNLPNMKQIMLNGIYYKVEKSTDNNSIRIAKSIYDAM
ncbi:uncharacterized protein ASCRUDRAFT_70471 [Ascoidea rubescens DSM 1968]|uniref:Uncharacterized protein n=1 Tax=Ascoidea rubescens DSM 1968 TaxID=1344418 RepID=A0A1D2VIH0_9ASCO|nr:hypothetical protein ASCRUDRAFT_70471 [Ascoidea rubescens DSM 1968]ODV61277.1 hypothetical protein ASCRUDRAFT_70471 [Ascoidea rubescens DSM 1968]